MKKLTIKTQSLLALGLTLLIGFSSCEDDKKAEILLEAQAGTDLSSVIEKLITLNGSASQGENLSYAWTVTSPDQNEVMLENANTASPSFRPKQVGSYLATLTVSNEGGEKTDAVSINVSNVTYSQVDIMGRPGINTVFNFFGDEPTKNNFNKALPKDGAMNASHFKGIFHALQNYIGLDTTSYTNVLGLDNATTASVLGIDVLNCNKSAPSTYGPSDLSNISLFSNVLNGRKLSDDVIDVTLILAFFGDGNTGNALVPGLITDNVSSNDKSFSDSFPYLASPH
ncbi:MAG: DUF4331 family protein [Cyclobacteriaceae bacterium]|nr:DUF4331 family protein [Cyclobacteriaceae bacterium HetDA_MAG_MS6]